MAPIIDEEIVDNDFIICIFDQHNNIIDEIPEKDYQYIENIFNEKLKNKKTVLNYFDNLIEKKMKKLKVGEINEYDCLLKDENNNTYTKYIDFYDDVKLSIDDEIYMTSKILKTNNMLQYGPIYSDKITNADEIIKIVSKTDEYILQRYYG